LALVDAEIREPSTRSPTTTPKFVKKKQHQVPTPKQSAVWLSGFAPLSFCFAEKFFSKELVPLSVGSSNEAEANDKRCIASYSVM
jgi:hypothetical protein